MADNVAQLSVVPVDRTAGARPQTGVIEFVERLLLRAKSGELQSIAVAYANAVGNPATGYYRGERQADAWILAAGVLCLAQETAASINDGCTDVPLPQDPA